MVEVRPGAGGGEGDAAPIESVDVVITERSPAPGGGGNARGGGKNRKSSAGAASPRGAGDGG